MIKLSQLESLIKAQEECLESLRFKLELAQEVCATAKSLVIEFTASAKAKSDIEKLCADPAEKSHIAARAQRAQDRAREAEKNYQKSQHVYNGFQEEYKKQEIELQRLKAEYTKSILSRALLSLSWLHEAKDYSPALTKKVEENLLNTQFSLPGMSK
jgi:hypothetical protein